MRPRPLRRATPPRSPCRVRPRRWCCRAGRSSRRSSRAGGRSFAAWPTSAGKWRRAWPTPMRGGSSTATSSPRTCCWTPQGVVWITDFGLAKASDDGLTQTGDILGTLRYMAPERFRGEGDGRADVYALGLTLYELLTLRPAFDSPDRLQLIEQIKAEDPPRPRALDPRIPRDLETIVLKAIAKDPQGRYPSADALGEDLRRFLADEPIRARRVSLAGRLLRWGRRNKAVAGLLSSVVVTLAAGFAVSTAQWIRADRHATRGGATWEGVVRSRWQRPVHLGYARHPAGVGGGQRRADGRLAPPPHPGARPDRLARLRVGRLLAQLSASPTDPHVPESVTPPGSVAATPNGRTLAALVLRAFASSRRRAHRDNPLGCRTDWKPRTFKGTPETFGNAIALSPDGSIFATGSELDAKGGRPQLITLWDAATGKPVRRGPGGRGATVTMRALAFSPDGKKLLWGDKDTTINLWDLETDDGPDLRGAQGLPTWCGVRSQGTLDRLGERDGTVKLWDLESRHEVHTFPNLGDRTGRGLLSRWPIPRRGHLVRGPDVGPDQTRKAAGDRAQRPEERGSLDALLLARRPVSRGGQLEHGQAVGGRERRGPGRR